jgi:hypothetical protein
MNNELLKVYIVDHGFKLLRLDGKQPFEKQWTSRQQSTMPDEFRPYDNVGLILGEKTGLVDIDIDHLGALVLSEHFLPPSNAIYGRPTKPRSHRLFRVADCGGTRQLKFNGRTIVEQRSNGAQSMIPPSKHPNGELVEFDPPFDGAEITGISWAELQNRVLQLAIATLVKPHWQENNRHDCALALSGVLYRADWSQKDISEFITRLCGVCNDDDVQKIVRDVDGVEHDRRGTVSVFNGPDPEIKIFPDLDAETRGIAEWINKAVGDGIGPAEIGIFVRSNKELARARAAVRAARHTQLELSFLRRARRCSSVAESIEAKSEMSFATINASDGDNSPSAVAAIIAAKASRASAASFNGGRSKDFGRSLRGGASRSRQRRRALPSPSSAFSITFRVRASASPSSNASIASVVLFLAPLGRPLGLPL